MFKSSTFSAVQHDAIAGQVRATRPRRRVGDAVIVTLAVGLFASWMALGSATYNAAIASDPEAAGEQSDDTSNAGRDGPLARFTHPREFHIGGYWGVPYTYRADVHVKRDPDIDLVTKGVGWDGRPAKSPIYYGYRVSQWLGPSPFGGMIDFTHNKTLARLKETLDMTGTFRGEEIDGPKLLNDIYKKLELSHGHNTLLATGLLRLPFGTSTVSPYVGLGAGIAIPHFEVHLEGDETRTYEYQIVGFAAQIMGGVEFRVAEKLSLFLEYKFIVAPIRGDLKSKGGGSMKIDLFSHQIVGGVNFRFVRSAAASK